jgi:hypothetical protein
MTAEAQVMEMSGLYGPYTCHEHVLQRIWAEQEFATGEARTTDGAVVEVMDPGKWNPLGGPDFRAATLRIGGHMVVGDVEVHFRAEDWEAHGHERDAAYAHVILHVVLFPPVTGRAQSVRRPTLVLLPLLLRDLEEIASDVALRQVTGRLDREAWDDLHALPPAERRRRLHRLAGDRWEQKVRYAATRIRQLGWAKAAHQTALEIMGYRFNRAQMLRVAERHPLVDWTDAGCAARAYEELSGQWHLQGLRPANHPKARLRQYNAWVRAVRDWPDRLANLHLPADDRCPDPPAAVRNARRQLKVTELRQRLSREITGGAVGGARLDNIVCDGLLPLMAARGGKGGFGLWFCWPLGDAPEALKSALRSLGLARGRAEPASHGWGQALLAWMLQAGARANR